MHRLTCVLLALLPAPLAAQTVLNLGVAGGGLPQGRAHGDLIAFSASEPDQGVDLNGDGQLNDRVLHVHRVSSGVTVNTGLTLPDMIYLPIVLGERLCAVAVDEVSIGIDRNGDGDAVDAVLAVYDALTGTTTNLGLAAGVHVGVDLRMVSVHGSELAFGVNESAQGLDLNGNGNALDLVLHRWSVGAPAATNLGLALVETHAFVLGPRHAMFLADEARQNADMNGDGDQFDGVVHTLTLATNVVTNLGIAARDVRGDGDLFAFAASELQQGLSFNSDGDTTDDVVFAYLAPAALLRNLGIPLESGNNNSGLAYQVRGWVIAWHGRESGEGAGMDWNGDGDALDAVLHTHHARSGMTRNSGLATEYASSMGHRFAIAGDFIGVGVIEGFQGNLDRDGDGDTNDRVAAIFDARTGTSQNLGLAVHDSVADFRASPELIAFAALEGNQNQDLNGDGQLTNVVGIYRLGAGTTTILPTPCVGFRAHAAGPHVVFFGDEDPTGVPGIDLNGDGDFSDAVLNSWNVHSGVTINYALPGSLYGDVETTRNSAVFVVDENAQGQSSLNGDADAFDYVMHVLRF